MSKLEDSIGKILVLFILLVIVLSPASAKNLLSNKIGYVTAPVNFTSSSNLLSCDPPKCVIYQGVKLTYE